MIRLPTRLTPTGTLFPYTTLFLSADDGNDLAVFVERSRGEADDALSGIPVEVTADDEVFPPHRLLEVAVIGNVDRSVGRVADAEHLAVRGARKSTRLNSSH